MEDTGLHEKLQGFLSDKGTSDTGDLADHCRNDRRLYREIWKLDLLTRSGAAPDKARMWSAISRAVWQHRRSRLIRRWCVAAAVISPFLIGGLFWFQNVGQQPEMPLTAQVETGTDSVKQVELLLNDGRVVKVQAVGKDSLIEEDGAGISLVDGQTVHYTAKKQDSARLIFNVLKVPRGCEYHLVLADGSGVWLNSDSELRFPVDFTGRERRVYLKGEAYFQVAKNREKPFRVEADEMTVEALGTEFDINAYRDAEMLTVTLAQGAVKVSDRVSGSGCVLKPGEQGCLQEGALKVRQVNVEEVVAWKSGRFMFTNMKLQEIARQLERWYDIRIVFEDSRLTDYSFTGVMKRYNSLDEIIGLIEETTNVKFRISGQNVVVGHR